MATLDDFGITRKWPAARPDVIQLYAFPTPNGVKVSTALEEMELDYEPHLVKLSDDEVKSEAFTSLNPNGKIPAIIDPNGPDGAIGLFESGAILLYLAEKSGRFLGDTSAKRHEITQWLMFQMGGVGPMFGQMGHFLMKDDPDSYPYALKRYTDETVRLLGVIDGALEGRDWIAGDYSIADMALAPWINALGFYKAKDRTGYNDLRNVPAYVDRFYDRPAVQRAKSIPDPKG